MKTHLHTLFRSSLKELGTLSLFFLAALLSFYNIVRELMPHLNNIQFDMAGDGLKNYYTFAYHYRYGSGFWFDGMLYPYGEHVLYTDGQPLLVWFFQGLNFLGVGIDGYELLALRMVIISSFALLGYFIYKIARHYKLPIWYAGMIAIVCMALSPQLCRMMSHFSLANALVIPLTWYLLIKKEHSGRKWAYALSIILIGLLAGYIHAYHLMSVCLLALSFALVKTIRNRQINLWLWLSGILPLVLFLIIGKLTDPVTDRPENPTGLLRYKTEISDLFPFYGYLAENFGEQLELRASYREGYCYLGVLIFIVPLILLLFRVLRFFDIEILKEKIKLPKELLNFTFAGLLILAFAMGLHVMLTGGLILNILPQLKQFRALGRLSWGFYYIGFVFLAVYWWHLAKATKNIKWRYGLLLLVMLGWLYNITGYHGKLREQVFKYNAPNMLYEQLDVSDIIEHAGRNSEDFQAIFTLPVGIEGAEIFRKEIDWWVRTRAIPYSFQSGLPLTLCIMSRTSVSRALNVSQLASSLYSNKQVQAEINDDRPFLVLISNEKKTAFADILIQADSIGQNEQISLYSLPAHFVNERSQPPESQLDLQKGAGKVLFYNTFYGENELKGLYSEGAIQTSGERMSLFDTNIEVQDSTVIVSSFWYKIKPENTDVPVGRTAFYNDKNELLKETTYSDISFDRLEICDNWVCLVQTDTLLSDVKRMEFDILGAPVEIDHVLVREKNADFFLSLENWHQLYNHHIIGNEPF